MTTEKNITRRAALGTVIASAAVAAPVIAAPVIRSINPDADIFSAWDRYREAHTAYGQSPDEGVYNPNGETDLQRRLGGQMDEAEAVMSTTIATTLRGAEVQLWFAIARNLDYPHDIASAFREDLDELVQGSEYSPDHPMMAALRSLRAIGRT